MKYIDYYPPVLREVYEIKVIAAIMDKLLAGFTEDSEALIKELYIYTATDIGLAIWENILGIKVSDESDLELRRINILAELLKNKPNLIESLNALLGEGNYSAKYYPDEFLLSVTLDLAINNDKASYYETAVKSLLEAVVPLNVTFEAGFLYNKHSTLAGFTHDELAAYTHDELYDKVLTAESE